MMPEPRRGQLNPFDAKAFKPTRMRHEESKTGSKPGMPSQASKPLPISMSQTFDPHILQLNQDVNRINRGAHGFKTDFNPDSPFPLEGNPRVLNWDSPQPCVSPSSLINIIPEQEGFSAPLNYAADFKSYQSHSKESNDNGRKGEEQKEPFGLFDWNWDDDETDGKSS